jgi:hypothetical protein
VRRLLVTANVVNSSPILDSRYVGSYNCHTANIPEEGILHSHRRENLKSYKQLTGLALKRRRNRFPVRYELGFYIPEGGILHRHYHERLKSHKAITGLPLKLRCNVPPVR